MGTNLPGERPAAIDWITQRLAAWAANAAAIGVQEADVTALVSLVNTASNARSAAGTAREESKARTLDWYNTADEAIDAARDLILQIKSFAASSDDPQVYVLAQLSPKDPPGETPAPEVPSDIKSELLDQGFIRLTWKGKGPRGTFYIIKRRFDNDSDYTVVATVTDKTFTDESVPFGTDRVTYAIDAQQTDKRVFGPVKTVQIGAGNGLASGEVAA
ncbi:MAG: hypothetical protein AAFV77_00005 [Planctomycetota bacterium]